MTFHLATKLTLFYRLIDVRNGYPYGTASAIATDKQMRTLVGSGNARRKAKNKNYLLAVENLPEKT